MRYIVYDLVYHLVYDIVYDKFFDVDICFDFLQIHLINKAIQTAKQGFPLYKLPLVTDPSEKIVETHVAALKWHMHCHAVEKIRNDGRNAAETAGHVG